MQQIITMKPYMYMYYPTNYVAPPEAIYIILIMTHTANKFLGEMNYHYLTYVYYIASCNIGKSGLPDIYTPKL